MRGARRTCYCSLMTQKIYPTTTDEIEAARKDGSLPLSIPVADGVGMSATIDFRAEDIIVHDGRGWLASVYTPGGDTALMSLRLWRVKDGDLDGALRVLESWGFAPDRPVHRGG